ncbi:MAG TPA: pilus assembly protein [Cellulomonas sp.]|nr:pilus assembly protein [Cellulomonas sp.]
MRSRRRAGRAAVRDDAGNAIVEFLAVTVLLLIPILYLVLVLGRLQAATFAADGAAREAGRAYAQASTSDLGSARAVAAVGIALRDQGFEDVDPASSLVLECSSVPCLEPGSDVAASVAFAVRLPFVPSFVRSVVPLEIPVRGDAVAPVDAFRGR